MTIWTKSFWQATLERIVRGIAIGALLYLGGSFISADGQLNALAIDWVTLLGYGLGGGLLSLLFSIIGNGVSKNGPAFVKSEQVIPPLPNIPAS